MFPVLEPDVRRLPAEALSTLDGLPNCWRRRGGNLVDKRSGRYGVALRLGLLRMLYSDSFLGLAQAVSGHSLGRKRLHCSLFCYEPGDYVGPHTDATSESVIALNLSLPNLAVAHQWLLHEGPDGFNEMVDVGSTVSIQVLKLPVWHQITPLVAKPNAGTTARRWLVSQGFRISDQERSEPLSRRHLDNDTAVERCTAGEFRKAPERR